MFDPSENSPLFQRREWLKALSFGGIATLLPSHVAKADEPTQGRDKVRGVIFMVSDGMSLGALTMAQAFSWETRKQSTRWWKLLNQPEAARGLMETASANSMVTDSAAASTAWGGGQRVNNGAINITPDGTELVPIAALLGKKNVRTGLVSTASITHATPAGFAAAVADRDDEAVIALQYRDRVDVLLGGGSSFFDAKDRPDQKDVYGAYEGSGYEVARNRDQMLSSKSKKLLGTFASKHMPYSIDRGQSAAIAARVPTLEEMARVALARFLEGDSPFLLQVEGARIDHAAHLNDIGALLREQLAFDDALAAVLKMTAGREDILVVVTSDHGNSNPGLNGVGEHYADSTAAFRNISRMKASHESMFESWKANPAIDLGALVGEKLGFTLKTDEVGALREVLANRPVQEWNHLLAKPEGLLGQFAGNHTGVGWTGTTHTSDLTLVSAVGPQSSRFSGMVVNTDVFRHLCELLG